MPLVPKAEAALGAVKSERSHGAINASLTMTSHVPTGIAYFDAFNVWRGFPQSLRKGRYELRCSGKPGFWLSSRGCFRSLLCPCEWLTVSRSAANPWRGRNSRSALGFISFAESVINLPPAWVTRLNSLK